MTLAVIASSADLRICFLLTFNFLVNSPLPEFTIPDFPAFTQF